MLSGEFEVTSNHAFAAVIAGCAAAAPGREDTWINGDIERLFGDLHRQGYAHSVECWQQGTLVGGLYGVSLGGVFFGESMFSTARDASKVALVHLVARMRLGGYVLLDTQFVTTHLAQFGAVEVPRDTYKAMLATAVQVQARWLAAPDPALLEAEIKAHVSRPLVSTARPTRCEDGSPLACCSGRRRAWRHSRRQRPPLTLPSRDVTVIYRVEGGASERHPGRHPRHGPQSTGAPSARRSGCEPQGRNQVLLLDLDARQPALIDTGLHSAMTCRSAPRTSTR